MTRSSQDDIIRAGLAVLGLSALILASVLALRLPASFVDSYIDEDGLIESAGAVCLFLASGVLVAVFVRARRADPAVREGLVKRLSYLALALLLFLAAGEEISWGQRIFDYGTPEAIKDVNSQGEVNLHNLGGDAGGQNFSWRAFQAFWVGWGILIPVVAFFWGRFREVASRYLPVLPIWLALLFAGQQLLWKPVEANWRSDPAAWNGRERAAIGEPRPPRITTLEEAEKWGVDGPAGLVEVMEANVQLLLFASALTLLLTARTGRAAPRRPTLSDDGPERALVSAT